MTDWTGQAACREEDPELFFPLGLGVDAMVQIVVAKGICGGCAVRERCLDWARENRIEHGIWGGHTEDERLSMRRVQYRQLNQTRFYADATPSWEKIDAALAAGWTMHAIRRQTGVNAETLLKLRRREIGRLTTESARRIAEADLSPEALQARIDAQDRARRGGESVSA